MMARHDGMSPASLDDLIQVVGASHWTTRMTVLAREIGRSQRTGRALAQRHAGEITLERLRRNGLKRAPTLAERQTMTLANEITTVFAGLSRSGKSRMRAALRSALSSDNTLVPIFHSMQYLALTSWHTCHGRGEAGPRRFAGYAVVTLALGFVINPGLFAFFGRGQAPADVFVITAAVASFVNLHHFLLDGRIWRLRERRVVQSMVG